MKRVALVIVGDEILDGSVSDTNSGFLTRRIADLGSQVTRIVVLPDEPQVVAATLGPLADDNDYVITSGGIGPTPDDRTYEAISLAFGVALTPHPVLVSIVERRFSEGERPWALRMASPPEGAELVTGGRFAWPLIRFRNLFVLPGVPDILEDKFSLLEPFLCAGAFHMGTLRVRVRESVFAGDMDAVMREYPEVHVGSYPVLKPEPHVRLVVRSKDHRAACAALDRLVALFDDDLKIDVQPPEFT
ncbi:MAG: competence/damage-inducible protein A [Pseudomonadota bacterium]